MNRRRSGLPKGARTAARIGRVLGASGTGALLIVCLVVAFTAIGSKYVSRASGLTACELPDSVGGPGVEVFGDSALLGLAHALPDTLAGGKVVEDVKAGRAAQEGENVLNDLADSAPAVFVISLAEDDASSPTAYAARIDELMLLLSGRTVYWVTAPGKDAYTKIVNGENTTPDPGAPETVGKWLELTVPPFGRARTAGTDRGRAGVRPGGGIRQLSGRPEAAIRSSTPWVPTAPAMRKWSAWTALSHSGQVGRAQSRVPVPCTCPTHRACAGSCGHSRTAPERRSTRDFGG